MYYISKVLSLHANSIYMDLVINKENVYREVAKTSAYVAAKMDDETAYERVFTTEENAEILDGFWEECKAVVCNSLKKYFVSGIENDGSYTLTLNLSPAFDEGRTEEVQSTLFAFFVKSVLARWFAIADKANAQEYALAAAALLEATKRLVYYKKGPILSYGK